MEKKRVGVLRGGTGDKYAASLRKGGDILLHISESLGDRYKTFDILVDKEGIWHLNGLKIMPVELINKVDVVWNVAGPGVTPVLDNFSIPNVSVGSLPSAFQNSRDMLREHMKKIGVNMPRSLVLPVYQKDFDGPRERYSIKKAKEVFEKFSSPWIVKSFTPDASMGIHVAKTFPELVDAIEDGVNHEKSILVEEFISGNAGSAHSLNNFRGHDIYIIPPTNLTAKEKEKLAGLVKDLHQHLGAEHYLKTDFIIHPKRGVFLTDIDLTPDLRSQSHLEQALDSVGAKMHNIVEHILEKAS